MTDRRDYVVHAARTTSTVAPDVAAVCKAVYDAVGHRAAVAFVDAYSDHRHQMPPDVVAAEAWLRDRGAAQGHDDPGIGVEISPDDEIGWAIAQAYTPWSIAVEVFDADRRSVAAFDDCGMSVVVSLTDDEASELRSVLPRGHEIEPLLY